MMSWDGGYPPYIPVAQRRANAQRQIKHLLHKGEQQAPVQVTSRKIADSFWGASWCEQLERHSDFASRLPRGRTYARNGSIVHLRLKAGHIDAFVAGSELYTVKIDVSELPRAKWQQLVRRCAGQVASVVELLQGKLPKAALEAIADPKLALFPGPRELKFSCSCPDWASMCKHVAAVLYGIGARLDQEPELFFTLRGVDWQELIATRVAADQLKGAPAAETLAGADLSNLFGIEMEPEVTPAKKKPTRAAGTKKPVKKVKRERKPAPTVTMSALRERGLSASTVQSWVRAGVLLKTELPGLYRTTAQTQPRLDAWQARRARAG